MKNNLSIEQIIDFDDCIPRVDAVEVGVNKTGKLCAEACGNWMRQ